MSRTDRYYLPLKTLLIPLLPGDAFALTDIDAVDRVWIAAVETIVEGDELRMESGLLFEEALEFTIPGLTAVSLSLGRADVGTEIVLSASLLPRFEAVIGPVDFSVNLDPNFLIPVEIVTTNGRNSFRILTGERVHVPIAGIRISFDLDGNISILDAYTLSLPPVMIGDTGIVVTAENVRLVLSQADATGTGGIRGLAVERATIFLPQDLSVVVPSDIHLENCVIGAGGFSGRVTGNWTPSISTDGKLFSGNGAGDIFGIPFALEQLALDVKENVPVGIGIAGKILLPYFDKPVGVQVNLFPEGAFALTLLGGDADGITITKEELLALNIKSLSVGKDENNVGKLVVTGGIEPLLMSGDGLQWPKLEVTDLSIDSTGKFSIKEAWLDLKELATLDLWGFHFELRRIGIGSEERGGPNLDRMWVDLSGGLRLIEQIPVALDVEGFRITWPQKSPLDGNTSPSVADIQALLSEIEVEFAGIYLFFGVPDAVEFEGLIRFFKDAQIVGFAGDVALRVPASGFGAEAGLLVGLSFEPLFPFLYVYFGVDLPAGIPLAQSGLALKGAQGMFGLNVTPDKTDDQNWYYDWYKRGPIVGAHPTNKWKPQKDSLALGVGVTITTADGYVKGTRGLIVLSIPGPILMIEGRALILSGLAPNAVPPLRALAVLDGRAGTVQFNIEAEATLIADLLRAYGMLEAFFDFNDLTNWHIYLGQDTPRSRRIRADILKLDGKFLFKADAYLMLDMVGASTLRSRLGVSIGFDPKVPKIDPLEIEFSATLAGDGEVTARPEQFSGEVDLSAHLRLSAFNMSVGASAGARFLTEGPEPFKVGAFVDVEVELPGGLDPFEATFEFEWQVEPSPQVESPLSEIAVQNRFSANGCGFRKDAVEEKHKIFDCTLLVDHSSTDCGFPQNFDWETHANRSPVVEVDSQPIIGFKQKMNSEIDSFARHPDGRKHHYDVGVVYFWPELTTIKLYRHPKGEAWIGRLWELIASTDAEDRAPLPGVWLIESDTNSPEAPSPKRIQLWTDNPLSHVSQTLGPGYLQYSGAVQPGRSAAAGLIDDYPDLMRCKYTKGEFKCLNFDGAEERVIEPGEPWRYEDLRFQSTSEMAIVRDHDSSATATESSTPGLFAQILDWLRRVVAWVIELLFVRTGLLSPSSFRELFPWLFNEPPPPVDVTDRCLVAEGDVDILFRRRVAEVRIALCQPSGSSDENVAERISARRGSRSVSELTASKTDDLKKVTLEDLLACDIGVPADIRITKLDWVISAREGFDCLHLVGMAEFAIREICYMHLEELERSQRATEQCKANSSPPGPIIGLQPDAYYRLDVITRVEGVLNLDDLPFERGTRLYDLVKPSYDSFVEYLEKRDQFDKSFHQTCLFQTEGPPGDLKPYVKWCHPLDQSERFFYRDHIAVRFLRSNMREMFQPPYALEIQVRDAEGNSVGDCKTSWAQAKSVTRFTEESVWEDHRSDLGWYTQVGIMDDVLWGQPPNLKPRSRYQLSIVRSGQKVLFSSTFVTSAFPSFGKLMGSYSGIPRVILPKPRYREALPLINDNLRTARVLAKARWNLERAEIQYRFETLPGGRKGLEQAKLDMREAAAQHDEQFREIAEVLADLYFQPVSDRLELYFLREPKSDGVICAWIRSPESLDLRSAVLTNPENAQSERIDVVGRTEIALRKKGPPDSDDRIIKLANADSTQLLIFPKPVFQPWPAGIYAFILNYHFDYGDETWLDDHRYDRPVEHFGEDLQAQTYVLHWWGNNLRSLLIGRGLLESSPTAASLLE